MSEDADLQAKIAALAGRINLHKQPPQTTRPVTRPSPYHQRWSPYSRGGIHKNRSLVLNGNRSTPSDTPSDPAAAASPAASSFVKAYTNGTNQLMTKSTNDRERQQREEILNQRQAAKKQKTAASDVPKDAKPTNQQKHELEFDGIRFRLLDDGSKLVRIDDPVTSQLMTPKVVKIADVEFFRTKRGNLIRATALKSNDRTKIRRKAQCEHFTKHGTCPFGPACKFTHDPNKVAICKDFLRTGSCPAGKACDLSHQPDYSRVSACSHFLRGNCTNTACRYPHVHVSPTAPVCRPFATLGFCGRGADCDKRHVFECPDYANHGRCAAREDGKCALPHIDRASALRKAAHRRAKMGTEDESDVSSSDDGASANGGDVDDDGDESELDVTFELGADSDAQALAQQRDFISF